MHSHYMIVHTVVIMCFEGWMGQGKIKRAVITALCALSVSACQNHNQAAMLLGAPREDAAQLRQSQTIRIQQVSDEHLLREATQVLLDLGFSLDESSIPFDVLP